MFRARDPQESLWLRQSILKQAFSGKLVPQDPNDEPASELLQHDRIRTEREAAQAAAKPISRAKRRGARSSPERQLGQTPGHTRCSGDNFM